MTTQKPSDRKPSLDDVMNELYLELSSVSAESEEYSKIVDQLVKLYPLKEQSAPKRISPDTLAVIGGNLVGILLILYHERVNVVTSKALSFVMKLR